MISDWTRPLQAVVVIALSFFVYLGWYADPLDYEPFAQVFIYIARLVVPVFIAMFIRSIIDDFKIWRGLR